MENKMLGIPSSSTIPQSGRNHIESIPVGTWEMKNIKCPPANTKSGREVLEELMREQDFVLRDAHNKKHGL